jgi:peptidoglycan/LPS O-acetylase OafA/YrhL
MARSLHPYRELPVIANVAPKLHPEELILYGLLVVIGAIPAVLTLASGASFGVDATLGLLMVCAGALGGIAYLWRTRRRRTR